MDMTLCDDETLFKLYAARGTFDLDRRGTAKIAALADKAFRTKRDGVGLGHFDLGSLADGPEDRNALDLPVAVFDSYLFLA